MVAEGGAAAAKQCFVDLAKADTSGDYDKALKTANKILRNFPRETLAFKCKLVAQIQLGQFEEALALIKKTPFHQMGDCLFEKAYVQYRLNDDTAAMETLAKANPDDVRCMELKAQLLYRAEKFDEAAAIFKKLLKNHSDDYDEERRANLIAVITQLHAMGIHQQPMTQLETFEQFYNGACHLIEAEKYSSALKMLQKAEKICGETLTEEGLSEDDIEDELSVIRVQKAFVLQRLGRVDEALKIYLRIQELNPSDKSVLATVANNIPSARREQNLMEARKKLKAASQIESSKLTIRQRRTLMLNQALVHLYSNQREPCRRSLEQIHERYGPIQEALLIEAALHLRSKDTQKALAALAAAKMTDEIRLAVVQISIHEGKLEEACKALQEIPSELASRPAILQLRVALLLATNQKKAALDLLSKAVSEAKEDSLLGVVLEQAASLNVHLGDYPAAVSCLQRLSAIRPDDMQILCRLIKAYSAFDTKRAEELTSRVFPQKDASDVDIDALERSDWILYGERYRQKKDNKMEVQDTEIVTGKLRKRKRKRKIILPKNYDPKVPPDPERWLPKQERTAYKKKLNKKHKDREIGRGTQGTATASPQLDGVSTKVENSPKPTPAMGAAEGPRQQRPAGQQPKKKKKKAGSKW
uniref:Signal recognition particle subunit SRP72 n=1 Tax=Ascaris suum TaxID=6253 RepID=F1KZJ3_ASCSU